MLLQFHWLHLASVTSTDCSCGLIGCGSSLCAGTYLRGAPVAEGLLCEATAALDVLCPLQEGGQLGLQHLGGGAERMEAHWMREKGTD